MDPASASRVAVISSKGRREITDEAENLASHGGRGFIPFVIDPVRAVGDDREAARRTLGVEDIGPERAPLYDEAVATFEADEVYDQADAAGFIRLNALRLRTLGGKRISEGE